MSDDNFFAISRWISDLSLVPDNILIDVWVSGNSESISTRPGRVTDCWKADGKFWTYDESQPSLRSEVDGVTHWMPVPAYPGSETTKYYYSEKIDHIEITAAQADKATEGPWEIATQSGMMPEEGLVGIVGPKIVSRQGKEIRFFVAQYLKLSDAKNIVDAHNAALDPEKDHGNESRF